MLSNHDVKFLLDEIERYQLYMDGAITNSRQIAKFNRYDAGYEKSLLISREMFDEVRMIADRIRDSMEDDSHE